MKKLLVILAILAGFFAATPLAEAGQYRRVYTPYGATYVNKYRGYSYYGGRNYRYNRYPRYNRSYRYAPYYRSYPYYRTGYRAYPRYYNSGYYNTGYYNRGYYNNGYCHTSRPRIAISFGF